MACGAGAYTKAPGGGDMPLARFLTASCKPTAIADDAVTRSAYLPTRKIDRRDGIVGS